MSAPLLDEVLEAHGGAARFGQVHEIAAEVRSWGGLFLSRRQRWSIPPFECRVQTAAVHAVLTPFLEPGLRGVFAGDSVRIESAAGEVLAERHDPRAEFRSFRRQVRWDRLDLLYFAGYAWWNYLVTPFLLAWPGVEVTEIESVVDGGERLRRLRARFPAGIPTHSREQVFCFGADDLLLRRHNYVAEVVGGYARGAHRCWEHREFGGLVFPTRRRVLLARRDGRARRGSPTIVGLEVLGVTLG